MDTGKARRRETNRAADPARNGSQMTGSRDSTDAPDLPDVHGLHGLHGLHDPHGSHGANGVIDAFEGTWIETVERFARQSGIDVLVAGPGTGKKGHGPLSRLEQKESEEKGCREASGIPGIWCVYREREHGRVLALVLVLENRSDGAVWQPCFQHEGPFCLDIPRALFELLTPPSAWSADVRKEEPEAVFWYRVAEKDVHERLKAGNHARLQGHGGALGREGSGSRGNRNLDGSGKGSANDAPDHQIVGHTALVDVRAEIGRRRLGAGRALGNKAVVRRSRGVCENLHMRAKPLLD